VATVQLKAGATLDFLTPEEHKKQIERVKEDFLDHMRQVEGETIVRAGGSFATNAAGATAGQEGNGAVGVYRVPAGYDAFLTRLTLDYENSNQASGGSVTCVVRVCADSDTPASLRTLINAVPNVFSASKSHAPLFRGGQIIVVSIYGGPVSTTFYPTVQVLLTKRKHTRSDALQDG
jgi:hypothetical protein